METQSLKPGEVVSEFSAPRKIFFYQRPDGSVFDVDEKDAWKIHKAFKQWGVSDGKVHSETLAKIKRESKTITREQVEHLLRESLNAEIEAAKGNFVEPMNTSVETFGNQKLKSYFSRANG